MRPHDYVGNSKAASDLRATLVTMAASPASVLLLGETGTGKELAARIIHDASPRTGRAFVAVDCGAVGDPLVDSTLFGHVRGAFTGASGPHDGLFAEAHGGTLFLDEVGNASPALQARLLRVLEAREMRAVGGRTTQAVDVRIVAATNRDLQAEVAANRFREDLLFRLDVLRVRLSPLRERSADIAVIAQHLLLHLGERDGASYELAQEGLEALTLRDWRGNVRELRNALEHAVVSCQGLAIGPEHLPVPTAGTVVGPAPPAWEEFMAQHESAYLLSRLEANRWNRAGTARELGISRQALYDRIHRYGLRPHLVSPRLDPAVN